MMSLERSFWLAIALVILPFVASIQASGDAEWVSSQETARSSNQSLLWGPYRSNLYFGVRPRIPKSLLTGLLWAKMDNYATVQNSTCTCDLRALLLGASSYRVSTLLQRM